MAMKNVVNILFLVVGPSGSRRDDANRISSQHEGPLSATYSFLLVDSQLVGNGVAMIFFVTLGKECRKTKADARWLGEKWQRIMLGSDVVDA